MRFIQMISIILILTAIYFASMLVLGSNGLMRYHYLTQEVEALKARERKLAHLTAQSQNRIQNGQNDEMLEESARHNYGMIAKNERIIPFDGD